ncbi:MAG: methylenetetrahydrofolate reductase [Candidatus Woesearchaeota archaeon]
MHITEYLKDSKNKILLSIEVIPPEKGKSINDIYDAVDRFMNYDPTFISVTTHPHERLMLDIGGKKVLRVKKKKLDTNAICLELRAKYEVEPLPHLICANFTKDETEDVLYTLNFHGIDNILALRGDFTNGKRYVPRSHGHRYASQLVKQIADMNDGKYLDTIEDAVKTNFCIGVAGYPEKHIESKNFHTDLEHLKAKIDCGASYIITQMFFDNNVYEYFINECRKIGINVPIIPGIKPIYTKKQLTILPEKFNITIPKKLRDKLEHYDNPIDVKKAGLEYTLTQSEELRKMNVPCIHFFTMGKSDPTADILRDLRLKRNQR